MLKLIRIFIYALKKNISSYSSRPASLYLSILGSIINNSLYVYGVYLIAKLSVDGNFNNINLFLISTALITTAWGLTNILFGGLSELGMLIQEGELEPFLATPVHPLFLVSISKIELASLAEIIQGLVVISYLGVTISTLFAFKILVAALITCVSLLSILIIGGTLSFFSARGNAISALLVQTTLSLSLFPMASILKGNKKWLLYLSPAFFTAFLPIQFISKIESFWFFALLIGSIILLGSSIYFFSFGLKKYKSANFIGTKKL